MALDTHTAIWLFPMAFMFHDFEELILGELWLRNNAAEIKTRLKHRVPAFLAKQIGTVFDKSASELAFPISLIFGLTCIASYLAVEYELYGFFLLASGAFFLHGFMHLGQALILRRYVPAVLSSVLIVIPYGLVLYWRLMNTGIVDISELLIYFLFAVVLTIPFILMMHNVGTYLYKKTVRLLID
jgi:hypothetical protein